jgi:hypothetical protein
MAEAANRRVKNGADHNSAHGTISDRMKLPVSGLFLVSRDLFLARKIPCG